jgi:hypothetical protein
MFTQQNTQCYSDQELEDLNAELEEILFGLEPCTDEYDDAEKAFSDEVSRR